MNDEPVKPTERDVLHARRMLDEFSGWQEALTWRKSVGCDDPPGIVEAIRQETARRKSRG
jgi:hypothetical protein